MAEKRLISQHKKTRTGTPIESRNGQTKYIKRTQEGVGMYVFIHGKGSKRVSFTRHCTEKQSEEILKSLK